MNWLKRTLLISSCLTVLACGDRKKDPLEDYEHVNNAVAPYTTYETTQTEMRSLVFIDPEDSLHFVEGIKTKVRFNVRVGFSDPSGLQYRLEMKDGPKNLGARFDKDDEGYYFEWLPRIGTLSQSMNSETYKMKVAFILNSNSSASTKAQLSGQKPVSEFRVSLSKDASRPIIKDKVTYLPSRELNPGQTGKLRFVVAAKGLTSPKDLEVSLYGGPDQPAPELVQLNGKTAVLEEPKRIAVLGKDGTGRTQYQYEVSFDTDQFLHRAYQKIDAVPKLKARRRNGRIKSAEAVFYIEAVNANNGQKSASELINFKVNFTEKAAETRLLGAESLSMPIGGQYTHTFYVKSKGGLGEVEVTSELPEIEGLQLGMDCKPSSKMANREVNCVSANCFVSCTLTANATCEVKKQSIHIPIKATSRLYEDEKEKQFNLKLRVQGKANQCISQVANAGASS